MFKLLRHWYNGDGCKGVFNLRESNVLIKNLPFNTKV